MKKLEKIVNHIKYGNLQEGIEDLFKFIITINGYQSCKELKTIENHLIVLFSSLKDLKRKQTINTIDDNSFSLQKNKITIGVLEIVEKLKKISQDQNKEFREKKSLIQKEKAIISKTKSRELVKVTEFIKVFFFIVLLISIGYLIKEMGKSKSQNQNSETLKLIKEAPKKLKEFRTNLKDNEVINRFYYDKVLNPLTENEVDALFNACDNNKLLNTKNNPFSCDDKAIIYNYLNYMDVISQGYISNTYNNEMIEEAFGSIALHAFQFYEKLIFRLEKGSDRTTKPWKSFQEFVKEYQTKILN